VKHSSYIHNITYIYVFLKQQHPANSQGAKNFGLGDELLTEDERGLRAAVAAERAT
jgi:hypothetical protein